MPTLPEIFRLVTGKHLFFLIGLMLVTCSHMSSISALPINMVLIDLVGRRYTGAINFLGCSIFFLLIQIHVPQELLTVFIFSVRAFSTGIFNFVYIYTSEVSLFPIFVSLYKVVNCCRVFLANRNRSPDKNVQM